MLPYFAGGAAYSDSAILNPAAMGGDGTVVGALFERDSYAKVSFAKVAFSGTEAETASA